jgi:hypothetical protein
MIRPEESFVHGMTISATDLRFDEATMWVSLSDGRTIGVPLAWFPRLMAATDAERATWTALPGGLHWEALDEDISLEGLLPKKLEVLDTCKRQIAPIVCVGWRALLAYSY